MRRAHARAHTHTHRLRLGRTRISLQGILTLTHKLTSQNKQSTHPERYTCHTNTHTHTECTSLRSRPFPLRPPPRHGARHGGSRFYSLHWKLTGAIAWLQIPQPALPTDKPQAVSAESSAPRRLMREAQRGGCGPSAFAGGGANPASEQTSGDNAGRVTEAPFRTGGF